MTDLTVSELATRLRVTRRRALELLADKRIGGRRLANGMWLAHADSVARYEQIAVRTSGRALSSGAAWGLLWELSGLKANWLSQSTHARVRRRIRDSSAEEIALAVASRTRAHHFVSANSELAGADLIHTGRRALSALVDLGVDLLPDDRHVSGYVRTGEVSDYATSHFMVAQLDGTDVLYDNTLPIDWDGDTMPAAVVAADLARSTDTRERSAGLHSLEALRRRWVVEKMQRPPTNPTR